MTSVAHAAAAASVLVGLVSVPAVSKTAVEPSMTPNVTEVSDNATSRQVTRQVSSDGFSATVSTAFNELKTSVTPGGVDTSLKSLGSKLEVDKQPGRTVWTLTTSSGSLKIVQTPSKTREIVETPQGTLKRTQAGATVRTSFDGSDRASVEEARTELKDLFRSKKQKMDRKRRSIAPSDSNTATEAQVTVTANESTGSGYGNNTLEHVVISNQGASVNLEGWSLENNNPQSAELESYVLESGESVKVYSSDVDADGITGTGISWENGGDTATLFDSDGEKVAEDSY